MNIDRREMLRYLGWRGQEIDAATDAAIERVSRLCLDVARPKHVVRKFDYRDGALVGTGFVAEGKDIRRHLGGCDRVLLFAATLGAQIERESERLFARSARDGLLFDTAASCAIESYCDEVCDALQRETGALTARFSCGYGDFPIQAQHDICALLSTDTKIGLCADVGGSLVPRKSVTALIGIKRDGAPFPFLKSDKCARCANKNCAARDTENNEKFS